MIEVKYHEKHNNWYTEEFRDMVDGRYVTIDEDGVYEVYECARPLKTTHTITDATGRTAELSDESFKSMDHLFN